MEASDDGEVIHAAARILVSLRHREVERWPEWVPQPPPDVGVVENRWPPPPWPKRRRSRPNAMASGMKEAAGAEAVGERATSPETPLDYHAAAGSGASTSGDDGAALSLAKRRPSGDGGSRGSSSGDEGCSSPAKWTRVDDGREGVGAVKDANSDSPSESCTRALDRSTDGLFDLNIALDVPWR